MNTVWKFRTNPTFLNNKKEVFPTMRKRKYLVYKNKPTRHYWKLNKIENKTNKKGDKNKK